MDQFLRVLSPRGPRPLARAADGRPEGDTNALPDRELERTLVLVPDGDDLPVCIVRDAHLRTEGDQPLEDVPRRDQDRLPLDHEVHGLFVQIRSVLDRAAAGAEGGHDPGLPMAVRRDDPLRPPRLPHDGLELVVRELLMDRMVHFAHHSTRGAHLDHPRPQPQLIAHATKALRDAVAQLEEVTGSAEGMDVGRREHVEVPVTGRRTQHGTAAVDMRPRNRSLVDDACEMNPEADEVPDTRETRNQSAVCIGDTPCGQDRKGGLRDFLNIGRPDSHEVTMAVPQARHYDRDAMHASPGGRPPGSLHRAREGDRGTVEDHATISDRFSAARDQEVCFDTFHDGRQRLRVNEDSGCLRPPDRVRGQAFSPGARSPRGKGPWPARRPDRTFERWRSASSKTTGPSIRPVRRPPAFIASTGSCPITRWPR